MTKTFGTDDWLRATQDITILGYEVNEHGTLQFPDSAIEPRKSTGWSLSVSVPSI